MADEFDILVKEARVIDGTGNPYYWADIAIADTKIVCIDRKIGASGAKKIIRAKGLAASPGFFDSHSHDDIYLLINPRCDEKVLQGVTTDVIGNCGFSVAPISVAHRADLRNALGFMGGGYLPEDVWGITSFADFLAKIEEARPGINVLPLVGHATVRIALMGTEKRSPTQTELVKMKRLTAEAMGQGAFGLSTALILAPAVYAQTEEIIEVVKSVHEYRGIYVTHMRSEGDHELEAIEEALRIGREASVPVHISHHKAMGKNNWGKSVETLRIFSEARANGLDVTCDQYPYSAASLYLAAALPPSIQEGGPEVYAEKLKDGKVRKEVINEIEKEGDQQWENLIKGAGFEGIVITISKNHENYIGKSIAEIARMENRSPYEVFFDLVVEEKLGTMVILLMMDEDDIKRIMTNPLTMIGTDGLPGFGASRFHPRMTGTFPRVLGRYVREQGLMTLEEAVRKMTSLPAQTFGIKEKGLLKEGFDADILLFDPETIIDKATYDDPIQKPEGISWVMVNGQVAVENGKITGATSGRVLRHTL